MHEDLHFPCRKFAELAFARAGITIRWEGPPGVTEVGVISEGEREGQVVVRISPKFFRPSEVSCCSVCKPDNHMQQCLCHLLGLRAACGRDWEWCNSWALRLRYSADRICLRPHA